MEASKLKLMFPVRTKETIFDGHDDNGSSTESILTSLDGSDALTDLSRIVPQLPGRSVLPCAFLLSFPF